MGPRPDYNNFVLDGTPGGGAPDGGAPGVGALAARVLAEPPRCGGSRVVLVDGPSGSGKTTLGGRLGVALGAPVLHMDDLYPGWDGLERSVGLLHDGVLAPLADGGTAAHRRWDWARDAWGDAVVVGRPPVLVVEGAGCGARVTARYAVLLLWVDAPREVRFRRGIERDGESYRPHWERWAAQERAHFAAELTEERADLRIDGELPLRE